MALLGAVAASALGPVIRLIGTKILGKGKNHSSRTLKKYAFGLKLKGKGRRRQNPVKRMNKIANDIAVSILAKNMRPVNAVIRL